MDTNKEYIKMCEQAPKLQPHDLEFENGDYIFYKGKWGIYFNASFYLEGTFNEGLIDYESNPFRIHTQDQLQGMVNNKLYDCIQDFYNFCIDYDRNLEGYKLYNDVEQFTSMEQLWLAFVMKEKYGKTWNGKEWLLNKEKKI